MTSQFSGLRLLAYFAIDENASPVLQVQYHKRKERPCDCRTAEKRDELAPSHSITSSARARSVGGMSRFSERAVWRLMTNSNLVDCRTGRSAGLAPLSMLPV